jgi:hypothetical protein
MSTQEHSTESRRPSIGKRFSFSTPPGLISPAGVNEVCAYIASQRLSDDPLWRQSNSGIACASLPPLPISWSWDWLIASGEFRGTFPKRVASFYYKRHNLRCPDQFVQQIGNLARKHCDQGRTYEFDFVDQFDWEHGEFGDKWSCYWGSNEEAREVLRENGALAIRFFQDSKGFGRAWLVETPDYWIVFNGYGHETVTIARVLSGWMSLHYRQVMLMNNGESSGLLYINGGFGYVIGALSKITPISRFDLSWDTPYIAECACCGERIVHEDNVYYGPDNREYCETCYYDLFTSCDCCGEACKDDELTLTDDENKVCTRCLNRRYQQCSTCGGWFTEVYIIEEVTYCENCEPQPQD